MLNRLHLFFGCLFSVSTAVLAQVVPPAPYGALPSARQLAWHETEMYVLIHFTPTTFENKEWGYGDALPTLFHPTAFDAPQIVRAAKAGGFRGLVFVAKHHDGFALWPTATTPYNISQSGWKNGQGDMVAEFSQASRAEGFRFGIYCSPWDRNNPHYGTQEYVRIYREQLKELYTRYGPLFMSWHDGANGGDGYYGGTREKRQIDNATYYGWDTTWAMTRQLQPDACLFSDVGWDVRWVGNEKGEAAETSWSTFTAMPLPGKAKAGPGESNYRLNPVGTRDGKNWMPAECDVPLRRGWFYHPEEDTTVKSPEKLFEIYLKSVGRGGALDLGLAPDRRGQLHESDVKALEGFGALLQKTFARNLASEATVKASHTRGQSPELFGVSRLTDGDRLTYWSTDDHVQLPALTFHWQQQHELRYLKIREHLPLGQRVGSFEVDAWQDGDWKSIAKGSSIGACRILRFEKAVRTTGIRIRITDAPVCPAISEVGLY
ncbi:MAG: alpha-L-fucosidase [Bacteroidetes bacterium]|nr:alpha-L-fucosidase [Bacteroidota bacterium]